MTRVRRVIPDLDDRLTHVLGWLDEVLGSYQPPEDDPRDPATLAHAAVRRLWDAVAPTQGERAPDGRLLGADGRYEHVPVRLIEVDPDDITWLRLVVEDLAERSRLVPDAEETLRDVAAGHVDNPGDPADPRWLERPISAATGLLSLLATAPTADGEVLAAAVTRGEPGADIVLTSAEEDAYRRWAATSNLLAAAGDLAEHYTY